MKINPMHSKTQGSVCPNCGYCPTCGRPDNRWLSPWYPPYNPWPWYQPWYTPIVTFSSAGPPNITASGGANTAFAPEGVFFSTGLSLPPERSEGES